MLRKDPPSSPREHKSSMSLPIGVMIALGLACLILGFVFRPDPEPDHGTTTESTFPPAPAPEAELEQSRKDNQKQLEALLAAPRPGDAEWQLLLAYNMLGTLEKNPEVALVHFEDGLEAATKFAAADPGNHAWQHEMVTFCGRLGDADMVAGKYDAVAARYTECLEMVKNLAAKDPDDVELQLDLVGSELQRAEARSHVAAARVVFTRLDAAGLLHDDGQAEKMLQARLPAPGASGDPPYDAEQIRLTHEMLHMMAAEGYRKIIPTFESTLAEPAGH